MLVLVDETDVRAVSGYELIRAPDIRIHLRAGPDGFPSIRLCPVEDRADRHRPVRFQPLPLALRASLARVVVALCRPVVPYREPVIAELMLQGHAGFHPRLIVVGRYVRPCLAPGFLVNVGGRAALVILL